MVWRQSIRSQFAIMAFSSSPISHTRETKKSTFGISSYHQQNPWWQNLNRLMKWLSWKLKSALGCVKRKWEVRDIKWRSAVRGKCVSVCEDSENYTSHSIVHLRWMLKDTKEIQRRFGTQRGGQEQRRTGNRCQQTHTLSPPLLFPTPPSSHPLFLKEEWDWAKRPHCDGIKNTDEPH